MNNKGRPKSLDLPSKPATYNLLEHQIVSIQFEALMRDMTASCLMREVVEDFLERAYRKRRRKKK